MRKLLIILLTFVFISNSLYSFTWKVTKEQQKAFQEAAKEIQFAPAPTEKSATPKRATTTTTSFPITTPTPQIAEKPAPLTEHESRDLLDLRGIEYAKKRMTTLEEEIERRDEIVRILSNKRAAGKELKPKEENQLEENIALKARAMKERDLLYNEAKILVARTWTPYEDSKTKLKNLEAKDKARQESERKRFGKPIEQQEMAASQRRWEEQRTRPWYKPAYQPSIGMGTEPGPSTRTPAEQQQRETEIGAATRAVESSLGY